MALGSFFWRSNRGAVSLKAAVLGATVVVAGGATAFALSNITVADGYLCDPEVLFIGARGSGQEGWSDDHLYGTDVDYLGPQVKAVWDRVHALNSSSRQISVAWPAIDIRPGFASQSGYIDSKDRGVASLTKLVNAVTNCPTPPRLVLVGYSQGAQVIKETLNAYSSSRLDPHLAAVVLVGDPLWTGSDASYRIGNANPDHKGVLGVLNMRSVYLSKTLEVCHDRDPVCSVGGSIDSPTNLSFHINYDGTWLTSAGSWVHHKLTGAAVHATYNGRIVRDSSTGASWYLRADGRRWIPDGGDYLCLTAKGVVVQNLVMEVIDRIPDYTHHHEKCTPSSAGGSKVIKLTRGSAASSGYWYSVTLSGFSAGQTVSVKCHDTVDAGGFVTRSITVGSNGSASNTELCYSADGPEHWVTGGGATSNRVRWGSGAVSTPTTAPRATTTTAAVGLSFRVNPSSCLTSTCNSQAKAMKGVMSGFTPNNSVRIWVYLPDGRDASAVGGQYAYTTTARTDSNGKFLWLYWWDPGMATGRYKTTIRDNATGRTTSANFTFTTASSTTTTTRPPTTTTTTKPATPTTGSSNETPDPPPAPTQLRISANHNCEELGQPYGYVCDITVSAVQNASPVGSWYPITTAQFCPGGHGTIYYDSGIGYWRCQPPYSDVLVTMGPAGAGSEINRLNPGYYCVVASTNYLSNLHPNATPIGSSSYAGPLCFTINQDGSVT